MKRLGCLMMMVCVLFLAACRNQEKTNQKPETDVSIEDVKRETEEAVETATKHIAQQRQAYQKRIQTKLSQLGRQINDLKVKAEKTRSETKTELRKEIAVLQQKKAAVSKKLAELRSASDEAWEDLKSGIDSAMEELENAYKRALSRFE